MHEIFRFFIFVNFNIYLGAFQIKSEVCKFTFLILFKIDMWNRGGFICLLLCERMFDFSFL